MGGAHAHCFPAQPPSPRIVKNAQSILRARACRRGGSRLSREYIQQHEGRESLHLWRRELRALLEPKHVVDLVPPVGRENASPPPGAVISGTHGHERQLHGRDSHITIHTRAQAQRHSPDVLRAQWRQVAVTVLHRHRGTPHSNARTITGAVGIATTKPGAYPRKCVALTECRKLVSVSYQESQLRSQPLRLALASTDDDRRKLGRLLQEHAIQKGTRVRISLWGSLMFGRVPGTRPNISEPHSEIRTRVSTDPPKTHTTQKRQSLNLPCLV